MIHPSAIVSEAARLAEDVEVGPYAIIGPNAEVAAGCRIGAHVVLEGHVRVGRGSVLHPFSVIGGEPQDKKYAGEASRVEIGENNVIREYCTINRGTDSGGGVTRVGDGNWIMAYVHIAHDCVVGSQVTMANGATLAGHVVVSDHVTFGAFTVVHQFCAVGAHAFSAMGTVILKDVLPYITVSGNAAEAHGINSEGLRRRGFEADTIRALRRAYKTVYRNNLTVPAALEVLEQQAQECEQVQPLVDALRASTRGIVR